MSKTTKRKYRERKARRKLERLEFNLGALMPEEVVKEARAARREFRTDNCTPEVLETGRRNLDEGRVIPFVDRRRDTRWQERQVAGWPVVLRNRERN